MTYTSLISWRSVRGPKYTKRVYRPKRGLCSVRLLNADILVSVFNGLITLTSRLSLPEVISLGRPGELLPAEPFLTIPFDNARRETLSERIVFQDSVRFLVSVGTAIYGIIPRDQGDGQYVIETVKLSNLPEIPHPTMISHSGDYYAVWPTWEPLVLQQFSWAASNGIQPPAAQINVIGNPAFQLLDIISGRVLVEDQQGITIFDFAF
ncbi:hypothetical protein BDN72DRAFT_904174 [Pluteus cervinus]|uniref:Uncharacterized protein n=1 Tax=Pluteus cervinus TaxID=181527 RepID=A0ACD3A7H0_9AGAR|nr:hypothetical protein BDN72DRAFT_904174 [Pluteus cervinus]